MATADIQQPCAHEARRPTVLIVEDEVLIRMLLCEALRASGYEVVEAANADEAMAVLETMRPPDLLITDVRMPGPMDGLRLAAFVRQTRPALKVIITSGHAGPDGAHGLADAFLPKPYDLDRIVQRVRALTPTR
jgi:CheY-like chemotaxis protein